MLDALHAAPSLERRAEAKPEWQGAGVKAAKRPEGRRGRIHASATAREMSHGGGGPAAP